MKGEELSWLLKEVGGKPLSLSLSCPCNFAYRVESPASWREDAMTVPHVVCTHVPFRVGVTVNSCCSQVEGACAGKQELHGCSFAGSWRDVLKWGRPIGCWHGFWKRKLKFAEKSTLVTVYPQLTLGACLRFSDVTLMVGGALLRTLKDE